MRRYRGYNRDDRCESQETARPYAHNDEQSLWKRGVHDCFKEK